ncbi:ATP-binding protein [Nonomuraea longicatena]|uniref:histidine kinase n=1 Tax=Nonomuraea longicatena TaxID=83682 RepID=A0ABP4A943_9ACTN
MHGEDSERRAVSTVSTVPAATHAPPPLHVAIDDLPDGLIVSDRLGRILAVNHAATRLTGVGAEQALGRDMAEVFPFRDNDGREWWKALDAPGGLRIRTRIPEQSLHLPGGPELYVSARLVRRPARSGDVERVTIMLRDSGARARLERSRANLVSTVAHELRSPLTSVKGFTATLLAKWAHLTAEQKLVMLETINTDADRVTRLITELLDVSRIESGRLKIHRQVVDLPGRVRRLIAGRVAAGETEDRFRLVVSADLPETWLDQDKIDQILGNLVENALRHGLGTVTIEVQSVDWGVAVSVRDQGKGVEPELAAHVFRQFWRGNSRRRGGTGLGLFIVKGLVEAHGGTIAVQRAPEGGAEFRFTMPAGAPEFA